MAGVNADISVVGLKEALASLNKIDKKARRAITTDFKAIVDTVISDAQNAVPLGAPISGFERNWTTKSGAHLLPWGMVQDTVVAGVSGKKPKEFGGFVKTLPRSICVSLDPQRCYLICLVKVKCQPPRAQTWCAVYLQNCVHRHAFCGQRMNATKVT